MKDIVIFGTGPQAGLVFRYISSRSDYRVAGFTVDKKYKKQKEWMGLPLVCFEQVQDFFSPAKHQLLIALGFHRGPDLWVLRDKIKEAKDKGFALFSYIDKTADIAGDVEIGENCIICPQVFIEPGAKIGQGVVLRTGCYIGHDVIIEDYCFVACRAAMVGQVVVKQHVFIGANAVIRNCVKIGKESVIGAGVVILKDVFPRTIVKAQAGIMIHKDPKDIKI
jgi:sugar O-acyltransferase (sialic acid O-acetyltransferase NeuD family)